MSLTSSSLPSGWGGSTCGVVFIPSSSLGASSSSSSFGQLLDQLILGQAFHIGGQPASVLRQASITVNGTRTRMHGGHFSFSRHLLQTPKISRTFLVCLGNRALAAWTTVLTFLLAKAFLARLLSSFLITCSALRLTPESILLLNP